MPKASEIDDIFAGKPAAPKASKLSAPTAGPSTDKAAKAATNTATTNGLKKKKKKTKVSSAGEAEETPKPAPAEPEPAADTKPKKRPAETIVDPSLPKPKKVKVIDDDRPLSKAASTIKAKATSKRKAEVDEEERAFRDSRGKEPRRKTEEGWNIYKEDELGMTKAGGDTPLCPFDCDCCF
ncbi:DUF1764-domain-containing protein [Calocera cornea HHB12733]|uniref:DUF1764-domain-containing protein n=1 Tax=Calocera cornea HHB12733 TaxID=1353952 RepID=A0A165EYR3_9BASI|nr:DUF1764-domain-containing protein [Calocera cornea HHB12733]